MSVKKTFSSLLREYLRYPDVTASMSAVNALQSITHSDVHTFKKQNRDLFNLLEVDLVGALTQLHKHNHFRSIGLFAALMLQDINLLDYCHPSIFKGAAGESASRLTAIIRQAQHAQSMRQGSLPVWASSLIAALVGTVVVLLLLIAMLAFVTSKL